MEENERDKVMQMYEASVPRELRDGNIVAGKATIENWWRRERLKRSARKM